MTQDRVLKFYNASKDLIRQSDSGQNELGACLCQNGYPVAYAYRAITELWGTVESGKGLLSLVFISTNFYDHVSGIHVTWFFKNPHVGD